MPNLFSRLFTYRERPTNSPLENYLIEALASVFERLDGGRQQSLVCELLKASGSSTFKSAFPQGGRIEVDTQVTLDHLAGGKRPDIVFRVNERPIAVVEVKLGAAFQRHEIKSENTENKKETRNQLETYADWIRKQNAASQDQWLGAVVLLTAWTAPPEGFEHSQADGVARSVTTWKEVGDWLISTYQGDNDVDKERTLIGELVRFLEEQGMMSAHFNSRDVAAALFFASSNDRLRKTFRDATESAAKCVPKLSAGRQIHCDFWVKSNSYVGWFYFARSLRQKPSRPAVSLGICFEVVENWAADADSLPLYEPFFFVECSDDNGKWETHRFLQNVPNGWLSLRDGMHVIVTKRLRDFPSDPDKRAEALKDWAIVEFEKLAECVPGYANAPAGALASSEDSED